MNYNNGVKFEKPTLQLSLFLYKVHVSIILTELPQLKEKEGTMQSIDRNHQNVVEISQIASITFMLVESPHKKIFGTNNPK